jgi:predicted dehydrogenase
MLATHICQEDATISTAFIGFGTIVEKGLLPAWCPVDRQPMPFLNFGKSDGISVVVVCDNDPARLAAARRYLPEARTYSDWEDALNAPGLKAAVIATPPTSHSKIAVAALQRGLHIFLEKPVALTPTDVAAVRCAAMECGRIAMVHLPWRYQQPLLALATTRQVRRREVTRIFLRFQHAGPSRWAPHSPWYMEPQSGMSLADLGPHCVDALQVLGAVAPPLSARLHAGGRPEQHHARVDMTICAGVRAHFETAWGTANPQFIVCVSGEFGTIAASLAGPIKGLWAIRDRSALVAASFSTLLETKRESIIRQHGWQRLTWLPHRAGGGPYSEFIRSIRSGFRPKTDVAHVYGWAKYLAGLVVRQHGLSQHDPVP